MSNEINPEESTRIDRGIPDLTRREKKKSNINKVFMWLVGLGFVCVIVILAMVFIKHLEALKAAKDINKNQKDAVEVTQRKDFHKDQAEIAEQDRLNSLKHESETPKLPLPKDATPAAVTGQKTDAGKTPASAGQANQQTPPPDRRYLGSVLVGNQNEGNKKEDSTRPAGSASPLRNITDGLNKEKSDNDNKPLDDRLTPSLLAGTTATLRDDLTYLLRRGTMIACVQQSKIVTDYPGMILCRTTKDTYGANGKVLLVERGSTVIGEQRVGIQRGQKKIFAMWSRIETDKGVAIDVNSPASDPLGATGIDAWIDNHWWDRFSNAIFISLIGDTLDGLKQYYSENKNGSGGFPVYPSQTQDATQNMATETLKNSINIPPTAYSNQGSLLNIFVARDVDFREVYEIIKSR